MAEGEERPITGYDHKRKAPPSRGRPGQNRLYANLGVRDLREVLDRKRNERGTPNDEISLPPPDPSYNYLKDPLREKTDDSVHSEQLENKNSLRRNHNKNQFPRTYKKNRQPPPENKSIKDDDSNRSSAHVPRGRGRSAGNREGRKNPQDIKKPLNIKIEFSTSTGEHTYTLDEKTILPTIRHVPDKISSQHKSSYPRSESNSRGGRDYGRRGTKQYQTRTIRNHNSSNKGKLLVDNCNQDLNSSRDKISHINDEEENWDDDEYTSSKEINKNFQDVGVERGCKEIDESPKQEYGRTENVDESKSEEATLENDKTMDKLTNADANTGKKELHEINTFEKHPNEQDVAPCADTKRDSGKEHD